MSFSAICWLIVKILGGVALLFLALGFTAKQIKLSRDKKTVNKEIDRND